MVDLKEKVIEQINISITSLKDAIKSKDPSADAAVLPKEVHLYPNEKLNGGDIYAQSEEYGRILGKRD